MADMKYETLEIDEPTDTHRQMSMIGMFAGGLFQKAGDGNKEPGEVMFIVKYPDRIGLDDELIVGGRDLLTVDRSGTVIRAESLNDA